MKAEKKQKKAKEIADILRTKRWFLNGFDRWIMWAGDGDLLDYAYKILSAMPEESDNEIAKRKYREWLDYKEGKAAFYKFPYWLDKGGE